MKRVKRFRISCAAVIIIFTFTGFLQAAENKDEVVNYIKDVSSIMTEVDIMTRNIGLNYLPIQEGARRMDSYIEQTRNLQYPAEFSRLHKMILLSFKKMRMGLLLFSPERRDFSVRLIRSGTRLLKYAAEDIIDIAKEEGLIKREDTQSKQPSQQTQVARPILPPVILSASLAAYPTPSPHIAAPPLTPTSINTPPFSIDAESSGATIHDLPSTPVYDEKRPSR